MFNSAEFWVAVGFMIAALIAFKKVMPSIKDSLSDQQAAIEKRFADAEALLFLAEKKFAAAQSSIAEFPDIEADLNHHLEKRINHSLHHWSDEKKKIEIRFQHTHDVTFQHLKDHSEMMVYDAVVKGCTQVLTEVFKQKITAKAHQQLVLHAIRSLPQL